MHAHFLRFPYWRRVLSVAPDALLAYWPLREPSGSAAIDLSGNGCVGAYSGVDFGYAGIGDGASAPFYDGTNDYCTVYSSGFATAFNSQEGTVQAWVRVANSGVWTDATTRQIFRFSADNSNLVRVARTTTNNQLTWIYLSSAISNSRVKGSLSTTDWFHVALSWSKSADQVKAYFNGVQEGATLSTLGIWIGSLASNSTCIGASSTTPAAVWSGNVAHVAAWGRALTAADVAELYRVT